MNLTRKEKTTVITGGIVVGLTILIAGVVAPFARKWSDIGSRLAPKLERVEALTERARKQEALLARRRRLVSRLGSLLGTEASAAKASGKPSPKQAPPAKSPEPKAASETPGVEIAQVKPESKAEPEGKQPEDEAESKATPGKPSSEPEPSKENDEKGKPDSAVASKGKPEAKPPAKKEAKEAKKSAAAPKFAAYLAQTAKKSGVKVKEIKPKRESRGRKRAKYFSTAALQIKFEGSIQNLNKLLHALEKGNRLVRIEQLQLRRDLKKGNTLTVTLDVVGYDAAAR